MTDELAGRRLRTRKLHALWITAGERRLVVYALHNAGFSNRHIADLLQVSPTTISKDLKRA